MFFIFIFRKIWYFLFWVIIFSFSHKFPIIEYVHNDYLIAYLILFVLLFLKVFKGLIIGILFFIHSQQHYLIQKIDLYKLLYQIETINENEKTRKFSSNYSIFLLCKFSKHCFVIFWHHFEEIFFYIFQPILAIYLHTK